MFKTAMQASSPIVKHLVLVGGGHSHLAVLKQLGMKPVPGLAVTLISREVFTPYSGSMPAYISGHYSLEDMHIDLRPLSQFAKVRLIQAEVSNIDLINKEIFLEGRPSIPFDLLSLNIGSSPDAARIEGSLKHGIPVKPIDQFLVHWQQIFVSACAAVEKNTPYSLAIIGGGPASVELAFAAHYKIHTALNLELDKKSSLQVKVVSSAEFVLGTHNEKAQQAVLSEFKKRHIEFIGQARVTEIKSNEIVNESGATVSANCTVFATGASIPTWPAECGLAISEDGFIEVDNTLRSTSHEFVFAAGDAATIRGAIRPKSGVYAVRQGKILARNLINAATDKKLKTYTPQKHALALLNLGNKSALAIRDSFFFRGRTVWSLKNSIDKKFVRKYSELPSMDIPLGIAKGLVDSSTESQLKAHAMRCAGCGAKVSGGVLEEVLATLPRINKPDILEPLGQVEDASQIQLGSDRRLVQSIDQIKAFTNDPWLFGRIATQHCLSDIYAMGIKPHSALAVAGVPFASKRYTKSQLNELMQGCAAALAENDCALIGGHSAETQELQFGLCVNGFAEASVLSKSNVAPGDVLILSKPLGSGTLLAADMRYQASHAWMEQVLETMLISNKQASGIFVDFRASACTDITGFGLAGHLLEMLAGNRAIAELDLSSLPAIDGSLQCLENGILSSLHSDNALAMDRLSNTESFNNDPRLQLLFDPQTSGGLLATVAQSRAQDCLNQLHGHGLAAAAIIGNIVDTDSSEPAIVLK